MQHKLLNNIFSPEKTKYLYIHILNFRITLNLPTHLHFLATEGGVDEAGLFHKVPRFDDSRRTELFAREVLTDLVRKELLSPESAERLLSWRHTGFNFHSRFTSHIPDKGQVTVRYFGLYANAKISSDSSPTRPWWTESSTTSS
jgi:hypothetical protein